MTQLDLNLHPGQLEVFNDPARLKVVAAGRRFGKSHYATVACLVNALKDTNEYGYSLENTSVYYIAPTFDQAKRAVWNKFLREIGGDVVKSFNKNEGIIWLVNGREIHLKGADRPDTLRGAKLSMAVLDEMAFMKPEVWNQIVRPALTDVKGEALFIGTPDGKNHFYDLYKQAEKSREKADLEEVSKPEWAAFSFTSSDNPTIPVEDEIKMAKQDGVPDQVLRQEYEASFTASGGKVFRQDDIKWITPAEADEWPGMHYIAVDPAGYEEVGQATSARDTRLDQTAIAVVKAGEKGWLVKEIKAGRWGVRETALNIIKASKDYKALVVGIESGSLKNAIMPYLNDKMRELNIFPRIEPVTHGGRKKEERIAWALQGRMQQGKIAFVDDPDQNDWQRDFINQMIDFPNPLTHDDQLDALSYIDSVATTIYDFGDDDEEDWQPLDTITGI